MFEPYKFWEYFASYLPLPLAINILVLILTKLKEHLHVVQMHL